MNNHLQNIWPDLSGQKIQQYKSFIIFFCVYNEG